MKCLVTILVLALVGTASAACSSKPCREVSMDGVPAEIQAKNESKNILVYKYDGSKQCGEGQELSLDAMSKQLRGVQILSMSKKHDGMMRIQVCGTPTGHANVYEISDKELERAKSFGFKPWGFKD